jgi:hypothetical protein
MADQFSTVNEAVRDHLKARYPQIELSSTDGLRLPLGKVAGRRVWLRLGVRPGERVFLRAMVAVRATDADPLPVWLAGLADAAERMAPVPLRGLLEPLAREMADFDQFQLVAPARAVEDRAWHWGPVVHTFTRDPPSMRAASCCVAALLEAIRPLVSVHVPGATLVLDAAGSPP